MSGTEGFFSLAAFSSHCSNAINIAQRRVQEYGPGHQDYPCHALIGNFLYHARGNPSKFEEGAQFNIEHGGEGFLSHLSDYTLTDGSTKDFLFVWCYRMALEIEISRPIDLPPELEEAISEARSYGRRLSGQLAVMFDYANERMIVQLVKRYLYHPDISKLVDLPKAVSDTKKLLDDFEEAVSKKETRASLLKEALDKYTTAFNFVGLHSGFRELRTQKSTQATWNLRFLFLLGFAMVSVPAAKLILDFLKFGLVESYGFYASALGLELVLIFFFKVCLHNYKSIKAQLLQIDLRMTLCQFIQDYARYAGEIKSQDKDILSGFEKIVFSGIVTSEDSIPSTFDGIEKIAEIVAALKK